MNARTPRRMAASNNTTPSEILTNNCAPVSSPIALMSRELANAAGTDPTVSHSTSFQLTVPWRACTSEPAGFIAAEVMRSLETAVSGGTPKPSTSTGVMRAPHLIPVRLIYDADAQSCNRHSPVHVRTPHQARCQQVVLAPVRRSKIQVAVR